MPISGRFHSTVQVGKRTTFATGSFTFDGPRFSNQRVKFSQTKLGSAFSRWTPSVFSIAQRAIGSVLTKFAIGATGRESFPSMSGFVSIFSRIESPCSCIRKRRLSRTTCGMSSIQRWGGT